MEWWLKSFVTEPFQSHNKHSSGRSNAKYQHFVKIYDHTAIAKQQHGNINGSSNLTTNISGRVGY